MRATPFENEDVFYGIAGSYGSLGILVSVKIQLVPIEDFVHLRYTVFSNPLAAVQMLRELASTPKSPDFLDGIVFSNNLAVVVEGNFHSQNDSSQNLPIYSSDSIYSPYYYQHVNEIALSSGPNSHEELMTPYDYFFRYDRCAYWMGTYLFHLSLLTRLIGEGIVKIGQPAQ